MTVVIDQSQAVNGIAPLILTASDGYELTGTWFSATAPLRGKIVVAGATAVPQRFYRRFAEYARERGYETLTFDYRGIGLSRPHSLAGFKMDLLDWGRLDAAAAVDAMSGSEVPLYLVGHSYGGHALALLPNHTKVAGCYTFGTGAGWDGWMPLGERLKVLAFWWLILPPLTWWKGYSPWKMLGMGEDLPTGAFKQWRHWCRYPHYFFDDPKMRGIEKEFAAVTTPIVAANALDDLWALPASRDAFMQGYRNAPVMARDLSPAEVGGKIGHMGYFRKEATPLWEHALSWFAGLPKKTSV